MSQKAGLIAAALTGTGAKLMEFPTPMAGFMAAAVFGVCMGVQSFMKVEVPVIAPKPKKISKKEKRAAAAAVADNAAEAEEDAKQVAKAAKKREKERARKEAKRVAAKAEEQQKIAAEEKKKAAKAEPVEEKTEVKLTAAQKKKKKQQEKKKKAAAVSAPPGAAPASVAPAPVEPAPEPEQWEQVKQKKGKKKPEPEPETTGSRPAPTYSTEIYVNRKHFPVIIGRGGSTLKSITEATNTEIDLPKPDGMRTEILISGPSKEDCDMAKLAIQQLVDKGYSDITHAGTTDQTIPVPEKKRSVLIGPGGQTIKMLQDKLGVKINMPEKGGDSDDVAVVGDSDAVRAAIGAIRQLIEQGYSDVTHENFIKCDVEVGRDLLSKLIGPGGSTIRGLQNSTNVKINVPSNVSGEVAFVTLLGEPADVAECQAKIAVLCAPAEVVPVPAEWTQAASLCHMEW